MPSQTLQPLHPRHSLRRLRTAFGPSRQVCQAGPEYSPTNTTNFTSPLSATSTSSSTAPHRNRFSGFSFDFTTLSPVSRAIRRKKSLVEVEQEEERGFDDALVGLIEPRPYAGLAVGGIEEVIEGRI